jgi:thiol-disulfide isomerase/thioredoxin
MLLLKTRPSPIPKSPTQPECPAPRLRGPAIASVFSALLAFACLIPPISLASGSTGTPPAASTDAAVPKTLPSFSLPDLEGKLHDPKEWKGKVVVIDFWATWCVSCRETIPVLQRLKAKYGDKGLVVAGITVDKGPKEKVAKFVRKMKMDYQILWDAEDTLSKPFGYEGLPSVYVFGRDGALIKAMPQYTAAQEKEMEALVEGQFSGR